MRRRDFLVALPVGATTLAIGSTATMAELLSDGGRTGQVFDPETGLPVGVDDMGSAGAGLEPRFHPESGFHPEPGVAEAEEESAPSDGFIEEPMSGPPPIWLLAPLQPGDEIGLGWRLDALTPVGYGATVISLVNAERIARVHVCARDGKARGIASTRYFDLLLMNDGDGRSFTDETLGRVVKTLGAYVARAERARPDLAAGLDGMLPHASRVDRYGDAREVLA